MLYKDSGDDFVSRVKSIETRADQCLEHFALLAIPTHISSWTILSATVHMIEDTHRRSGPDSSNFRGAMLNLARHAPLLIRWLGKNEMTSAISGWIPQWDSLVGAQAFRDLRVVANYDAFRNSYPMWHRDRLSVELLGEGLVRFHTLAGSRGRQVSAFQKGFRRQSGVHQAIARARVVPTEAIVRRYKQLLDSAKPIGELGFHYEHSYELANRTFHTYIQRLSGIMRRSENLDLGPYTLGMFKRFYAALQTICTIHEHLCFLWGESTGTYPIASAVLVKPRYEWNRLLSFHSGLTESNTKQLLNDLTFYSKRLPDLHVFPLVPLDEQQEWLAVVPHFILNSSPEDNILRTCSYLRQSSYDRLSDDKAAVMREDLLEKLKRFRCEHSIPLPDGSTEIDLLVEDIQSSTVVIAELKWYRKPSTYRERLRADADFEDGYKRQLATTKTYCRQHPNWLHNRNALGGPLSDYKNVFYLLIGRDHWSWFDPQDEAAVVEFEQFRLAIDRHTQLDEGVREVSKYDWLPIEDEDFHVQFDRGVVEGVGVESEVYYGGPPNEPHKS